MKNKGRVTAIVSQKRRQDAIAMIGEGKSQKEVARVLGVTPVAVCKSLKKLRETMQTATAHDYAIYRKGQLAILEQIEASLLENKVTPEVAREWRQIRGDIATLLGLNSPAKSIVATTPNLNPTVVEFLKASHGLSEQQLIQTFESMKALPRAPIVVDASYLPPAEDDNEPA